MTSTAFDIEQAILEEQLRKASCRSQVGFKHRTVVRGMAEAGWRIPKELSAERRHKALEALMTAFIDGLVGRVQLRCWSTTFTSTVAVVAAMADWDARAGAALFFTLLPQALRQANGNRQELVAGCIQQLPDRDAPFLRQLLGYAAEHDLRDVELVHALRDAVLFGYADGFKPGANLPHAAELNALINEAAMTAQISAARAASLEPCSATTPRARRVAV